MFLATFLNGSHLKIQEVEVNQLANYWNKIVITKLGIDVRRTTVRHPGNFRKRQEHILFIDCLWFWNGYRRT